MVNAVSHIIAAANRALHEEDDDDFQQVVNTTRRSFRRSISTPRRGRRSATFFKRKVLLLRRSNADYCPIKVECEMLTSAGMGYSDIDAKFQLDWNLEEIEDYICSLYPSAPLKLVGFKVAKMDRQKKLIFIEFNDLVQLRDNVGQSQIVIIPNRDLPLAQVTSHRTVAAPLVHATVTALPNQTRTTATRTPNQTRTTAMTAPSQRTTTTTPHDFPTTSSSVQVDISPLLESSFFNDVNDTECNLLPIFPTLEENAEIFNLSITRANCVHDMFKYYTDETLVEKNLLVLFENEMGIDGGGLTKELFNLFFKQVENLYFQGEDCLVPFLPLNRIRKDKQNFTLIGRILEHMLLLTGSIPSKLSKIMLLLIADPNKEINKNILVEEFYNFLNPCERSILKKSVNNFSSLNTKEKDVLINTFNSFHFYEMPSSDEIVEQVASIALNTLVQAPKQFIETMRIGINVAKHNSFWNKCDFATLLDFQKPTPNKVANCLKAASDFLTNEETKILHFLEMYIRCLHDERIGQFVFLVTGSYQMPDYILIEFSTLVGLAQRPTFSTCTNTIHVPTTYCSYQELRQDFDLCLLSDEAYVYTTY